MMMMWLSYFVFFFSRARSLCVSLLLVINERNEENARFRSSLSVSRFLFASIFADLFFFRDDAIIK
jgi:hypothetical protein